MSMYRIGPADLFTPSDLAADANTLNGQINTLDNQDMTAVSQSFFDAWQAFVSEWRAFYSSHFGGFFNNLTTALNDSNRDQLIQFEGRFATFASQYQQATNVQLPGGVIDVSTGAQDTLGALIKNQLQPLIPSIDVRWIAAVAVGGVVLFVFRKPIFRALSGAVT